MSSSYQIKIGAIMAYVSIGINIVSGLLYTPWMIGTIGRENFGLYTLAMSVISLFVFDFGLSASVTRFIAKYLAEGRQDKANDCLGVVYRLYVFLDVVLLLILTGLYFFIPQLYRELTPDEIEKFKVVYVMASLYSVFSLPFIPVQGILRAHEKFIQISICDILHKLLIVIPMTCCLLLGYGLYALVMINIFSGVVTIFAKTWVIIHYTQQRIHFNYHNTSALLSIVGFSGWVTVIAVAQRFVLTLAPSILGVFSGTVSIAILGIAMTIEGYTFTFANALNGMFLPKVSRIVANNQKDINPLMVRIGRIQILIVGLVVVGFISLGKDFIQLWVGEDFSECYVCALLIVIPSLFSTPQEVANSVVFAMNKVKIQAIVYIFTSIFNIICILVFVKHYAALAVCISVCITFFLRTGIMDYVYWRKMKLNVPVFFRDTFGRMLLPLVLTILAGICLNYFLSSDTTWFLFLIKGIVFVCVYIAIMWTIGMNREEKDLVIYPLKMVFS